MNGYLVVARGTFDDLPLRLFGTEAAAEEFAATVDQVVIDRSEARKLMLDRALPAKATKVEVMEFQDGLPARRVSRRML